MAVYDDMTRTNHVTLLQINLRERGPRPIKEKEEKEEHRVSE